MIRSLALLIFVAACQPAPVGVRNAEVPRDAAQQCTWLCSQIGLSLDSVVIMADNVGCVCRAAAPPAATPPGAAASSAGGMAAIMMTEQVAAAAQRARAAQPK